MNPEIALVIRAVFLVLVVVVVERAVARRRARVAEQRRTLVRLPMVLNPTSQSLHGRPLEFSVVRPVQGLVGHDRDDEAGSQPRQPGAVRLGDWLLDQIHSGILEHS